MISSFSQTDNTLCFMFLLAAMPACPKSIRLYFFPEKPVMAGWQI
jgi:hypothetical protein